MRLFYLTLNCICTLFSERIVLDRYLLRLPFADSPLFIFVLANDNQEIHRYSWQEKLYVIAGPIKHISFENDVHASYMETRIRV